MQNSFIKYINLIYYNTYYYSSLYLIIEMKEKQYLSLQMLTKA